MFEKRLIVMMMARVMARQQIPYKWGGNDPAEGGLDCSGFIRFLFRIVGLIPYTSDYNAHDIYRRYSDTTVPVAYGGCLVFYGPGMTDISHVMLAVDPVYCVGAASHGVMTPSVQETEIRYRTDILAIVDPFKP